MMMMMMMMIKDEINVPIALSAFRDKKWWWWRCCLIRLYPLQSLTIWTMPPLNTKGKEVAANVCYRTFHSWYVVLKPTNFPPATKMKSTNDLQIHQMRLVSLKAAGFFGCGWGWVMLTPENCMKMLTWNVGDGEQPPPSPCPWTDLRLIQILREKVAPMTSSSFLQLFATLTRSLDWIFGIAHMYSHYSTTVISSVLIACNCKAMIT